MCDVAVESIFRNGYAPRCSIINKDVRHVKLQAEGGEDTGLTDKSHLCIFEVSFPGICTLGKQALVDGLRGFEEKAFDPCLSFLEQFSPGQGCC